MKERVQVGLVKEEDAEHFTIQEFLPGVRYYPHYFFSPLANTVGYKVKNGTLIHMGFDKRIEPIDEAYRALPDVPLDSWITRSPVTSGSPPGEPAAGYFQNG